MEAGGVSAERRAAGTLSWSHTVSPMRIPETGIKQAHHDASHYGDPTGQYAQNFVAMKRWLMERFASLILKLANTPDADRTLLDNTLVVLVSELGDSYRHDHERVPFVLGGRAGGALKPGRLLDYRGKNQGKNEDHTKLLVSIANMVGVATDSYGTSGATQGSLPGLQA